MNCNFCEDIIDSEYEETYCCLHICHKDCLDIVKDRLYYCPLCFNKYDNIPIVRVRIIYENYFTASHKERIFKNIQKKLSPLYSPFGRTITVRIPMYGDFYPDHILGATDDIVRDINKMLKIKYESTTNNQT